MCLENNKILYCDSRGDKRFSALYAKVNLNGVIDSIENHYQNCKRDELGNIPGKGKPVNYMVYQDKKLPASKLSDFYKYLWKLYFIENPDLLEYASQFDEFIDRFKGKAINCQADVIKELVLEYIKNTQDTRIIDKDIMESKNSLIIHQVNCKGVMGAGLAKQIRQDITDEDFAKYQNLCKEQGSKLLGKVLIFKSKSIPNRLYANLFAQDEYGTDKQYTDYKALEECFNKVSEYALYENPKNAHYKVNIPYGIGCGLGGGDWNIVNSLIKKCFSNNIVRIYRKPKEGVNFNITPSMKSHIKINNKEENNMLDVNKYVIEEKLDVNSINKDECSDKIKNKFFMYNNKSLKKFFYEIDEEDYSKYIEYLLSNDRKVKDSNLKFETASKYFKDKARDATIRLFLKVPSNVEIVYTNMMSKSVAKYGDEVQYLIYDEDAYRDNDSLAELRNKNSYKLYIEEDPRSQALDTDLIDKISQIYTVVNKAVQKRLVMLLDLEGILNNIVNIIEYSSEGNITEYQYKALVNSYNSLLDKLTDEDIKEYIKEHNDIDVFASNEDTKYDYITTYQRVLRKITCNFNENLEDMKSIIHNDLDELEDIILANDTELLYEDYSYNRNDYDDTDEYTENLVLA